MVAPFADHRSRFAIVVLALFAAGCQTVPPAPLPAPTPAPAPRPAACPVSFRCRGPTCRDGASIRLPPRGPRSSSVATRLLRNPKSHSIWQAPCTAGERVDATSTSAVRAFFTDHFSPYASPPPTATRRPRHRLLRAAACRLPHADLGDTPWPLYGPPDDLLVIDLADLFPELKDKRVRGRVDGRKVVPYARARGAGARSGAARRQDARVCRRSGRGVLPRDPGLRAHRVDRRLRDAASTTPTRTAIPTARSRAC